MTPLEASEILTKHSKSLPPEVYSLLKELVNYRVAHDKADRAIVVGAAATGLAGWAPYAVTLPEAVEAARRLLAEVDRG